MICLLRLARHDFSASDRPWYKVRCDFAIDVMELCCAGRALLWELAIKSGGKRDLRGRLGELPNL